MNKKILLLGLVVLSIVICTSMVSAYIGQGPGPNPWVRVGGRTATTGGYASAYMPNLIAGTWYGPGCPSYNSVSYYNAAKPCGGSWFGGYSNYGGANYGWGGAWGNYGSHSTYSGNVGWASKYPSYNYNYMYTGYV